MSNKAEWEGKCAICGWIAAQRDKQDDSVGKQALIQTEIDHVQRSHPARSKAGRSI